AEREVPEPAAGENGPAVRRPAADAGGAIDGAERLAADVAGRRGGEGRRVAAARLAPGLDALRHAGAVRPVVEGGPTRDAVRGDTEGVECGGTQQSEEGQRRAGAGRADPGGAWRPAVQQTEVTSNRRGSPCTSRATRSTRR